MSGPEVVPRLLSLFALSTDYTSEYIEGWNVVCPFCGIANGLCLKTFGTQQDRPHRQRVAKARRKVTR